VEEERERAARAAQDEQAVEAHRKITDEDNSSDREKRETDDDSDVEAHRQAR
jgi:hypothetical protein